MAERTQQGGGNDALAVQAERQSRAWHGDGDGGRAGELSRLAGSDLEHRRTRLAKARHKEQKLEQAQDVSYH